MKYRHFWLGAAASLCMGILILDSRTALEGAKEGVELCIRCLIPSLFPFFVLSGLITGAFSGMSLPVLRPVGRLLRIPPGCESLLIPAFLGGYPAGAQCIGQALSQNSISRKTAGRLLLFCNNAGPSFLFGVLAPVFPSKGALWALWGIQTLSCLLFAWLLPNDTETGGTVPRQELSMPKVLSASVRIMGTVCGWVVLFRVLLAFLSRWFLWLLPRTWQTAATGVLELANGCLCLGAVGDIRLRFLLCSGMLAFGGLCVTMQTASAVPSLSLGPYVFAKIMQCLFCLGISSAFLYRRPIFLVLTAFFWYILKKVVTSPGSMVYTVFINQRRNSYAVS